MRPRYNPRAPRPAASPLVSRRVRRTASLITLSVATAVAAAACGSGGASGAGEAAGASSSAGAAAVSNCASTGAGCSTSLVTAAENEALKDAGGKKIGGSVSFLWGTTGRQNTLLQNMFKPFTEATGISVNVQASSGVISVLEPQVQAGDPPDLAWDSTDGDIQQFAGHLVPIDSIIGKSTLNADFNSGDLQAATLNGHVYSIPETLQTVEVYYNPKLYKGPTQTPTWNALVNWAKTQKGTAPFCVGLEQGAFSANDASQVIDEIMLTQYGPSLLQGLSTGAIKYDSPDVIAAFKDYLNIYSDNLVYGGVSNALLTNQNNQAVPLTSTPQDCQMLAWGPWTPSYITSIHPSAKEDVDYSYFDLGSSNSSWGPDSALAQTGGGNVFVFKNTPQVDAFVKYLASPAFQTLVASTGNWPMANVQVPKSAYPGAIMQEMAAQIESVKQIVVTPFGTLPPSIRSDQVNAVLNSIKDPSSLAANLQSVDTAYAQYKAQHP
jgi:alpha-glucoside transport system substrate-binding protein